MAQAPKVQRILSAFLHYKFTEQALRSKFSSSLPSAKKLYNYDEPLLLTQLAFMFGKAAWSLLCSIVSGGSW